MSKANSPKSWTTGVTGAPLWITIIALLLLVLLAGIWQVWRADDNPSRTEVAILSVVQTYASILVGLLFAAESMAKQVHDAIRRFAIAAFRRILEIEMGTSRLLSYVETREQTQDGKHSDGMETIKYIAIGIKEAVNFSISDWADIIGPEVDKLREIESLKSPTKTIDYTVTGATDRNISEDELKSLTAKYEKLLDELPASLKVLAVSKAEEEQSLHSLINSFYRNIESGKLSLLAIHDSERASGGIDQIAVGRNVIIKSGLIGARRHPLIVFTEDGKTLGSILNTLPGSKYSQFVVALKAVTDNKDMVGTIVSTDNLINPTGRGSFRIQVEIAK